ncbi:MAG: 23S rRNA (uracil(1939)-C(5))-methyltransferase RlmD [Bacilli bacterium]|nr:23S rRNA (uracil(1939)-C(5))-methyltransferase RlmD [Bacilli bacterium]MDD3304889.1 23S rRNA (uracil(1939)-C(5))-methyltransferase RlmD [Bacilli bacterium]MDD4053511.1 23S rRNA (uracil(1939)-C(5))-methyltransferase RlmD [Bacilli bacterium]MDD4411546.1 23S rRNA (uracil(1939)-C(5))-methyltransferase RlmD [Bacilli bacterium]
MEINEKYKVKITGQENSGQGVSKIDDMIVFVENGLPDDEGEVLITEIKKNYARGRMVSFNQTSSSKQEAPCPFYNECGGCDLQHQLYKDQLAFKEDKIKTALTRIGGFNNVLINKIIFDEQFYYRNKVTLKVDGEQLGFYKRNTNEIVEIDNCIISNEKINEIIKMLKTFVRHYNKNNFKSIMIRYSDALMISVDSRNDKLSSELVAFLINKISNIKSISLNNKIIYGENYIEEKIDNLTFKLSPTSFYQVNINVMKKLYCKTIEYVTKIENKTILDLYCGIGTISILLANHAKSVVGIEMVKSAVDNAIDNLAINGINNVMFIHGKVEKSLDLLEEETVDTIVMDPPRNGVDKKTLDTIIKINPQQIVYISCNPATLARDLKILSEHKYELVEVTPFDMFPQTNHVECVVLLYKKS